MNIIILSRNAGLYSTNSLIEAARRLGHFVRVLDHMQCDLIVEEGKLDLNYNYESIRNVDAVIPRIGSSATSYGAAVIRQFEGMGVYTPLTSDVLMMCRDKLSCLQHLAAHGIPIPRTGVTNNQFTIRDVLNKVSTAPYVIKLLNGTQGLGVILSETFNNAESIMEAFMKTEDNVMVQRFVPESKGSDLRVFVVGDKIIAAMKRQAQPGEFRSNLHRGGYSFSVKLSSAEEEIALKTAKVMGVQIAGIDILQGNDGPMVIEVNVSPGLEGIESTTKIDIAGDIIKFVEQRVGK
ncbi:MAG TPA: RimK family alpha-L-glutamate ligase [Saprospiraceae bacterium]|mgnify:CR=1 FL=1|nr:RimK family alpha-L-glutamate ligase [Saprospiraceae bacterium]